MAIPGPGRRSRWLLTAFVPLLASCNVVDPQVSTRPLPNPGPSVTAAQSTNPGPATPAAQSTTASSVIALNPCQAVKPALLAAIINGLKMASGLRFAWMVRSSDAADIYMVAADLEGPGLDGAGDFAVWATNDPAGNGLIFSVDDMAKQFSSWGPGTGKYTKLSATSDGVGAAKGCAASTHVGKAP